MFGNALIEIDYKCRKSIYDIRRALNKEIKSKRFFYLSFFSRFILYIFLTGP